MASVNVVELTDAEFEAKILKSDVPCLVDFWAPWCGPCKALAPTLDALADEFAGKAVVAKMNVDDNQETPGKYGVRAIPTLILVKGGEVVEQTTGAAGKDKLAEMLNSHL